MTEVSWKLVVRGLKTTIAPDRKLSIEREIRRVAGESVPLRVARKELLSISMDALRGRPRLVTVHEVGVVCLISMEDLLEVLAEPGPTLNEVIRNGKRHH